MSINPLQNITIQLHEQKFNLDQFLNIKTFQEDHILSSINFINDLLSDKPTIVQKTSGSTGAPKAINIYKSQIEASAKSTLKTLSVHSGDNALLCINPDFIGGKMMIARALIGGLNLIIAPVKGNPLKDFNKDIKIDFFSFVPYQLDKIIDETAENIKFLDQSKAIILGGAPVSESLSEKIKNKFKNTNVYSTYGMTETVSHVALKKINSFEKEVFQALEGVSFSTDEKSRLIIHAKNISGIDALKTNDVVKLHSTTSFEWLGRHDFVINSGGIKIHPEQLEQKILKIFSDYNISNNFFIYGKEDEMLGETVNLLLEGEIDITKIRQLLIDNIEKYHQPKSIQSIPKFIETPSGKLNRNESIKLALDYNL
ncbi:AMP-binding protein [Marivirga arenosa]|uniref:AMP-binding protein n=1 Tax=Marivirga arenosa TaxID=3059076 RepID=A0AA51N5L0_9BACT|nr:AMP-binding protein [Marivirga sp. ABR2-2]WMN06716.1 AMP-binding protein [Marivirga sp. ABR2-2]